MIIFITFTPVITSAHPGRTDSSGCHTCKTNCPNWGLDYGEYHCHRSKGVEQPKEPIKSTFGEAGTGYTAPAPEYKTPTAITKSSETTPKNSTQQEAKKNWFSRFFNWFK